MRLDVGAMGVARVLGHAALDQVKRLVEPADFLEREGVNRLEPPVIGKVRTQHLEEFDLLRVRGPAGR